MELYRKKHVIDLPGRDLVERGLRHFSGFIVERRRLGLCPPDLRIGLVTSPLVSEDLQWLVKPHRYRYMGSDGTEKVHLSQGYAPATVNSFPSHVVACANWHYERAGALSMRINKCALPEKKGQAARQAAYSLDSVGKIITAAAEIGDRKDARRLVISVMLQLGCAVRPEASFELSASWCIDRERYLLHTQPPNRSATRKR